jgi:hypothetical protein
MSDTAHESQQQRSRRVLTLIQDWKVPPAAQPRVLGLPDSVRYRHLERYRDTMPLPDDEQVQVRIDHLLGIDEALYTTFPRNPTMGPLWMRSKCRHFGGRKPMDILLEDGLDGLIAIRSHLDCAYEWELDEKKNQQA